MRSFITKIYLYSFFADLIFIYPVYSLMFVERGLSPLQISILLMVWAGTSFILEVPSGVIADKYSRKNILVFSQLVRIIGYMFWVLVPNFLGFLIGFILWGIKSAFTSGTLESFIFDELKACNLEGQYAKVLGRVQSLSYLAILFSGIGASLSINYGYSVILWISIISLLISTVAVYLIPSTKAVASTEEAEHFTLLHRGLNLSFKNVSLLQIIIFVSLVQALFGSLDEYLSIFASEAGLIKSGLGIFFALYGLVQVVAAAIAYKIEQRSDAFFQFLILVNGLLLLIASYFYQVPSLALLLILSFLFKLVDVVMQSRLQHQVKDESVRATIISVKGFFVELVTMGLYLAIGSVSKYYGYQKAFISVGYMICLIGIVYLVMSAKRALEVKQ